MDVGRITSEFHASEKQQKQRAERGSAPRSRTALGPGRDTQSQGEQAYGGWRRRLQRMCQDWQMDA